MLLADSILKVGQNRLGQIPVGAHEVIYNVDRFNRLKELLFLALRARNWEEILTEVG
jgi:hypothetical protein